MKTLGERGIECIFVGYVKHSKAFRFYVIEPNDSVSINSIIESKDVIFDEHRFSSVPRPSQRSLVKGIEDSSGSMVPEKTSDEIVQQSKPQLRKSKRHGTPKDFGPKFQLYLIKGTKDEDVDFWKEAINDDMDSIMGNNTWVLTHLPTGCRPLGCKWIFKRKLKVDGTVEKFKARLVIQGFKQKSGIHYFDTYALVARISTIRLLIAMTSIHNMIIHQMDVKTAFLNGELEEEVYMNQPLGFILPGNENKVSDKCVYSKFDASALVYRCPSIFAYMLTDIADLWPDQVLVDSTKEIFAQVLMKDMGEAVIDVILDCELTALSRYTSNPGIQHWQAIQRVLKYLKKTMDYSVGRLHCCKLGQQHLRKFFYQWLGIPACGADKPHGLYIISQKDVLGELTERRMSLSNSYIIEYYFTVMQYVFSSWSMK
ncbi:zinc finger, CCHC-type containing protein [Tanacetum coccineum]